MSLIQEALKRKLEEQQGAPAGALPPPAPPLQKSTGRPSKGGAFGRVLGFFVALLLLIAVAVSLFYLAAKNWNWRDAVAEARSDAGGARQKWESKMREMQAAQEAEADAEAALAAAAEDEAAGSVDAEGAAGQPLANVQGRVQEMKDGVVAFGAEHADVVTGAPAPEAAGDPAATVAAVQSTAQGGADAKPGVMDFFKRSDEPKKSGPWPRITVNGILSGGQQGGGAAMINNRVVSVNELVEGARVLEVQAKGVLMEYKGATRLLLTGQTSEE
jgi:hypothetical protein